MLAVLGLLVSQARRSPCVGHAQRPLSVGTMVGRQLSLLRRHGRTQPGAQMPLQALPTAAAPSPNARRDYGSIGVGPRLARDYSSSDLPPNRRSTASRASGITRVAEEASVRMMSTSTPSPAIVNSTMKAPIWIP